MFEVFYSINCFYVFSNGGHDINAAQIMDELRFVVTQPLMDTNSALILNAGVHLLKSVSFYVYQEIINGFIYVLKQNYKGHVIWKTTTSIGDQQNLYSGCSRRFHTEQVLLDKSMSLHEILTVVDCGPDFLPVNPGFRLDVSKSAYNEELYFVHINTKKFNLVFKRKKVLAKYKN